MPRIIVLSTCGNMKEAGKIGRDLVQQRLAACINILPVTSCFRWKGKISTEHEYLLMIKTRSELFAKLRRRILSLHSYQLPEILSIRILNGYKRYLEWIDEEMAVHR